MLLPTDFIHSSKVHKGYDQRLAAGWRPARNSRLDGYSHNKSVRKPPPHEYRLIQKQNITAFVLHVSLDHCLVEALLTMLQKCAPIRGRNCSNSARKHYSRSN